MNGDELIACIGEKYIRIEENERRIFELVSKDNKGIHLLKELTGLSSIIVIGELFDAVLNRCPENDPDTDEKLESWLCFFRLGEMYTLAMQHPTRRWLITNTTYFSEFYPNLSIHNEKLFDSLKEKTGYEIKQSEQSEKGASS